MAQVKKIKVYSNSCINLGNYYCPFKIKSAFPEEVIEKMWKHGAMDEEHKATHDGYAKQMGTGSALTDQLGMREYYVKLIEEEYEMGKMKKSFAETLKTLKK